MRIRDPMGESEEPYNLVPLTDMVFNLLIFFMCATTFAQVEKELAVQLPHASQFTPISAPPKQLIINIKQDGTKVVNGRSYDDDALSHLLARAISSSPTTAVIVRADERTIMRNFADVTRLCRKAGVGEAKIVYIDDSGK
jgi:biopolymer transport protein ExbD